MAISGDIFDCRDGVGGGLLLAPSVWGLGMLLTILQCTGKPPKQMIIWLENQYC